MTSPCLVTIGIPVFNRPEMLRQAVISAQNQTYGDLEILVSDNASTDETVEVARSLAEHDSRIRILVSEHNVSGLNYDKVVANARGEYLKFLNSDDLLDPRAVARLIEAFEPGVNLAYCVPRWFGPDGQAVDAEYGQPLAGRGSQRLAGRQLGETILSAVANVIGCPSVVMARRSEFDPRSPFGFAGRAWRFVCEIAPWLHLLEGGDAAFVDEVLVSLRVHPGQDGRVAGKDLLRVFNEEALSARAFARGWLPDEAVRQKVRAVSLKAFTNRPYAGAGTSGGLDQLEGIRLAVESLLGPGRPLPLMKGIRPALAIYGSDDDLRSILHTWWQAFPSRGDLVLLVRVGPDQSRAAVEAVVADVRECRGWAETPVSVLGGEDPVVLDRGLVLLTVEATVAEVTARMPTIRQGAPPWAPVLDVPFVFSESL